MVLGLNNVFAKLLATCAGNKYCDGLKAGMAVKYLQHLLDLHSRVVAFIFEKRCVLPA